MSDLFLPTNDDWGDGHFVGVSYPPLPDIFQKPISTQGVSKTVQKRHARHARDFERMVNTIVHLGGEAGQKKKKSTLHGQKKAQQEDVQLAKKQKLVDSKGEEAERLVKAARTKSKQPPKEQEESLVKGADLLSLFRGLPGRKSSKAIGQKEADGPALKAAADRGNWQKEPKQALAASLWDNDSADEVNEADPSSDPNATFIAAPKDAALPQRRKKMKGLPDDTAGKLLPEKPIKQGDGKPVGPAGTVNGQQQSSATAGERSKGSKKRARQAAARLRAQARASGAANSDLRHASMSDGPADPGAAHSLSQKPLKHKAGPTAPAKKVQPLEGVKPRCATTASPDSATGAPGQVSTETGGKRADEQSVGGVNVRKEGHSMPSGRTSAEDDIPAHRSGRGASAKGSIRGKPGLMEQMASKLQGSRFRWLNEQLYTSDGEAAFQLMQEQPQLFTQYHEGFRQQTQHWPSQPLDVAVKWLASLPASLTVVDFGCGDAELARRVKQSVHSLDLVASTPGVIACNMANTPLETGSMDVAVFCLALMGTDYPAFLAEASRVLKPKGRLWIAEVRSRFMHVSGSEDFSPFLSALKGLGFRLTHSDSSNKMFVVFELVKKGTAGKANELAWPELKPCLYKRR